MNNQKKSESNKKIQLVLDAVIKKCVNDISRIIDENKDKELNIYETLDIAYKSYNLEYEIIINYEKEVINAGLNNRLLNLEPKELNSIKHKIKDQIYKKYFEKLNHKKH